MHTVLSYAPLAAILLAGFVSNRWARRPSARARWAALSLRDKIARQITALQRAAVLDSGYLVVLSILRLTGLISPGGWLAGTIFVSINMAILAWLLHAALAAREAYNSLGPWTYIAEMRNTFGDLS